TALAAAARREAHHGRRDRAEVLGVALCAPPLGVGRRALTHRILLGATLTLLRTSAPDLLVEHREVLDLGENLVGRDEWLDPIDQHVDRASGRREPLELALREH